MTLALDALVRTFMQRHGHTWQMYLIQQWPAVVGNLHARMCLEKIQGDTIVIGVYDPHWMQELFLLNSMLLEMINAHFDKPYVKQIRLKLAKQGPVTSKQQKKELVTHLIKRPALVVTPEQHDALAQIQDEELKKIMQDFLRHCK